MEDTHNGRIYKHGPITDVYVTADYYVFTETTSGDCDGIIAGYVARHPDTRMWRSYGNGGRPTGLPQQSHMALALADVAQYHETRLAQRKAES
jgi:hypothetical protein